MLNLTHSGKSHSHSVSFSSLFAPNKVRFSFGSINYNELLPSHFITTFCHCWLLTSHSYPAMSHPVFGWMFYANSQRLPGGWWDVPGGVCVPTSAQWSPFLPLSPAASSCVLQCWLQPLFTLQMQATIILGMLLICVIYLLSLWIPLSPEWWIILINSMSFLCIVYI